MVFKSVGDGVVAVGSSSPMMIYSGVDVCSATSQVSLQMAGSFMGLWLFVNGSN